MTVKFLKLKIENFKSIENLEIDFHNATRIYGANESGKTSVADAISWVLTGKNSLGDSTFNIVPIESVGVSPTVELKLSIDDKKPTLKRVLKAKIGRDKQYTGEYSTECYVNGVKYTQRDFEKWIADNICDPEIFKLIHDVRYFTENISTNGKERPWEARRRLLTSICGIEHDNKLALLDERFKTIYEHFNIYDDSSQLLLWLKSEMADAEKSLDLKNWAIEKFDKMCVSDVPTGSKDELLQKKKQLEQQRDSISKEYNDKVYEQNELIKALGKTSVEAGKAVFSLQSEINKAEIALSMAKEHYEKYGVACPTCGRKFARGFSEGKKSEYDKTVSELTRKIDGLNCYLEVEKQKQERHEADYQQALSRRITERPAELAEIEKQIADLTAQIAVIEQSERQKEQFEEQKKRAIKEMDELSEKLSHLQRDADLTKDFISFKMGIVSGKINSMFNGVEFVLFRQNKSNEDVRECCDVKFNGTDYHDLSYSTKFYCSLLIVMGFQKAFNVTMPIICDNAESIDLYTELDAQSIFLIKNDGGCPMCGKHGGRKQADGKWHCDWCGNVFVKKLYVGDDTKYEF